MARTSNLWKTGIGGTYIQTIGPAGYDILINGINRYLNFDTVSGTGGYGFRDNGGVMEFKNSGGAWTPFGSGSGATLPATTVGFGNVSNLLTGSLAFIYDTTQNIFMASDPVGHGIEDIYFGKGITHATPSTFTIHGTGGIGKDKDGADWVAAGGIGTGAGIPGKFRVQTSTDSGGADTDPQTLRDIHEWSEFQSWSEMGQRINRVERSNDYTLTLADYYIAITGEAGGVQITLPAASNCPNGTRFEIKDTDGAATTFALSVKTTGLDTIDGYTTYVLSNKYQHLIVTSDGVSNWEINTN